MPDMMKFPDTWEEFLRDYEFKDSDEVYTNGSMLIPSFRVVQMLEHYFANVEPERVSKDTVLILPCPFGTTVWGIFSPCGGCEDTGICPGYPCGKSFIDKLEFDAESIAGFGSYIFLKKSEAESALAKMRRDMGE